MCIGNGAKFEYIRRITGYLVDRVDRWNDEKSGIEIPHKTRITNYIQAAPVERIPHGAAFSF